MTPEEYKRIKEAEKEHLRKLKELKTQLRKVKQQKSVADALKNIEDAPGDEIIRTHEEMIDRLAIETVQEEARLEIALSEVDESDASSLRETVEEQQQILQSDAELKKLRAQELVRQIKLQMGLAEVKKKQNSDSSVIEEADATQEAKATGKEAGKTLDSTSPGELPEKTIGRIPRKKS